jgi:hypothetical protein
LEWPWGKVKTSNTIATDGLIRTLEDRDPDVCCRAAAQAGKEHNRAAVFPLVRLLLQRGSQVSKMIITAAAWAIGDLRAWAIPHLYEARFAHVLWRLAYGFDTGCHTEWAVVSPDDQGVLMD